MPYLRQPLNPLESIRTLAFNALLVFILSLQSLDGLAQFCYGLRAGGQLVTMHSNDDRPYTSALSWRPSYHGGLFFMYQFSGDFSAVADFLYSDKGYSIGDSYKVHMEYLSIPLMGQYHFNGKVSVLAGIESNLFLGAHAMADGYRNQGTGYDRLMTFAVGGGVAYQLNPHVNVMARYFHGVSNAANENRLWIPDFKIDSRVIQLSLGYFYRREEDKAYNANRNTAFSIGFRQGISKYVVVKKEYYPDGKIEASSGRNGYQAEIDFRLARRRFYTSIGAVYSQKGGVPADEDYAPISQEFISVPFIIGYSPVKSKYLTFSIEGGLVLNHLLSSKNMPAKSEYGGTKDDIASALYGFELSTDVFPRVMPFISYRKEIDMSFFYTDMSTSDYYYELLHKGQVLSIGLRLKPRNISRDKAKVSKERFTYRARMDSIVRPFSFGLKAGINLNNTVHDEPVLGKEDHSKALLAGHGGMYFQIRLYKRLSFLPEVAYIRKGFKFDYDNSERKAIANYIEFPLIISYQVTRQIAIDAGAVYSILLNSKFDPDFSTPYHDDYDWYYTGKGIGLEKGLLAGARFNINSRFSVGARYFRGISDISFQNWSDVDEYNTNVQLFTSCRLK